MTTQVDSLPISTTSPEQVSKHLYTELMDRMDLLFDEMNEAYLRILELEKWREHQDDDLR